MQLTVICNVLLLLLCYKLFGNWEVPIHLGFHPFHVVGGFPALVESFFDNFFDKSSESSRNYNFHLEELQYPIVTTHFRRDLNWSCSILESSNKCITVVSSSECLADSQFSYSFWEFSEDFVECFHKSKGHMECKIPFQIGNQCQNVVKGVQKSGNSSIFFELEDVSVNTQIIQTYGENGNNSIYVPEKPINSTEGFNSFVSDFCQNYSFHETVLIGGENDTNIFPFFPFGVNSSNLLQDSGCMPPFPSDSFICNCRNSPDCQVPIIYVTPNSTFCRSTTISVYHTNGFIYSAIVTSSSDPSIDSQQQTVLFFDLPQSSPLSKFDLKRGRFHCPSETSCISEILYPFSYLNSLEIPYQMGIFVFSVFIGIAVISNTSDK